jgi:hypothetical protein
MRIDLLLILLGVLVVVLFFPAALMLHSLLEAWR